MTECRMTVAYEGEDFHLSSGIGFHLQPDGRWEPEKVPDHVVENAKFSGFLTIQGYRCVVFELNGEQWAQKSTGTVATTIGNIMKSSNVSKLASRVALRVSRYAHGLRFHNIIVNGPIMSVDVIGSIGTLRLDGTLTSHMDESYAYWTHWEGTPPDFGPNDPYWSMFVNAMDSDPNVARTIEKYYDEEEYYDK